MVLIFSPGGLVLGTGEQMSMIMFHWQENKEPHSGESGRGGIAAKGVLPGSLCKHWWPLALPHGQRQLVGFALGFLAPLSEGSLQMQTVAGQSLASSRWSQGHHSVLHAPESHPGLSPRGAVRNISI